MVLLSDDVAELTFVAHRPVWVCLLCSEEFTSERRDLAYATLGAKSQIVRHVARYHPEADTPTNEMDNGI